MCGVVVVWGETRVGKEFSIEIEITKLFFSTRAAEHLGVKLLTIQILGGE